MNKQNSKAPVGSGALLAGNILITGDPAIGKTTLACRIKAGIQALEPSHRVEVVNDAPGNITRVGIQMLQNANDTLIFVCYRNRDVRKLRRWGFKWRVLVPMHLKANARAHSRCASGVGNVNWTRPQRRVQRDSWGSGQPS